MGWHSFCRCTAIPKLAEKEDFIARQRAKLKGEEVPAGYDNEVTEMPESFNEWVEENKERIENAKTEPYFIRDNREVVNAAIRPRGETLKQMEQRLGEDMPPTLKNLQAKIDESNRAVKSGSTEISKNEKLLLTRMHEILNNGDFGMNIPLLDNDGNNVVEAIFNSYFKNQIETHTGKGWVNVYGRKEASQELFGTPLTTKAKEYEKYGFVMSKDILKQARSNIAAQYWSYGSGIQVRFRKDKVLATFTCGDSLCQYYRPSLTTDPQICSLDRLLLTKSKMTSKSTPTYLRDPIQATEAIANRYIELQYHGLLTLDCIESVFIPRDVVHKLSPGLFKKIKATGAILYSEQDGELTRL